MQHWILPCVWRVHGLRQQSRTSHDVSAATKFHSVIKASFPACKPCGWSSRSLPPVSRQSSSAHPAVCWQHQWEKVYLKTWEKMAKVSNVFLFLPKMKVFSAWMPYNFSLTVFTQRNFVADFLKAKCDFTWKTAVLRLWTPLRGLSGNVWCSS